MLIRNDQSFSENAGYSNIRASGDARASEDDVQTCSHCQKTLRKREWLKRGGWCKGCDKPLCFECAGIAASQGCKPFIQVLEEAMEDAERVKQLRRAVGLDEPPVVIGNSSRTALIIARS